MITNRRWQRATGAFAAYLTWNTYISVDGHRTPHTERLPYTYAMLIRRQARGGDVPAWWQLSEAA